MPQEHAALLHAWIKLELADNLEQPDLQRLFSHAKALQAAKPEVAALQPLWLTISAAATASAAASAAASADSSTAAELRSLVRSWRGQADDDSAEFEAELMSLSAVHAHMHGHRLQVHDASSYYHTCGMLHYIVTVLLGL